MPSGDDRTSETSAARRMAESLMAAGPSPGSVRAGARLGGRYVVRGEIAHGGMGTVLEAWDEVAGRTVALKIIRLGGDVPAEVRARFLHEAEVTARLEHPNIVPVYDMGESADPETGTAQAYFCMKKVEGEDLRSVLRRLRAGEEAARAAFPRGRLLGIFQDICMAVAYAHDRGVIHRDLKPANVMLGPFGETLVVDWGLAAARGLGTAGSRAWAERTLGAPREADASRLTLEGQAIGTPGYMAPEQEEGRWGEVDERSDVWALGVILREMVGGDPPADLAEIVEGATRRDRETRTPAVRILHDGVSVHLEGAAERDRRRAMASAQAAEGARLAATLGDLRSRRDAALAEAAARESALRGWTPIEEKRGAWEARDRAGALRNEFLDAFGAAHAACTAGLAADPGCREARAGLAALYWDKFLEAEAAGDRDEQRICRRFVEQWDDGAYADRLRGDGTLAVRALQYTCDCLARAGQHAAACRPVPLAGARGWLFEWREHDRRLVPMLPAGDLPAAGPLPVVPGLDLSRAALLGAVPFEGRRIPMGSWLLVLAAEGRAPVRVPFTVRRRESVAAEAVLYREGEIPAGFVQIPAGEAVLGADPALEPEPPERVALTDVFFAVLPVTNADWLLYLDDLATRDPAAAAARVPRRDSDLALLWTPAPDGRWSLPAPGTAESWLPDHPVTGVTWTTAADYAAWRSAREGRAFALPSDAEWERAARGADGRWYPWGNHGDPAFSNGRETHPEGAKLLPAGSMPSDESPYGVRDLAGNAACWCRNRASRTGDWRAMRGGASMNTGNLLRSAYRFGMRPNIIRPYVGVRLVMHPVPPHDAAV